MRKPVLIPLIVLVVLLLGASVVLYQKLQKSSADYATLQSEEQASRDRYGEAVNEIAAIQDSLSAIVLGDEGTQALETQLKSERSLSKDRGEEAKARIALIKAGVERAKTRIADLEARLKESGVKVVGLEKMVQNLRRSVVEKEQIIAQLTGRVDELQTQVTGLVAEVQQGQQTIQVQTETIQAQTERIEVARREIGRIYYTIGSKKDLSNAGMIESKGGLLGIGKTVKLTGQIDETMFTAMDTDQETVIRIPAEKARVLSNQPVSSYELQPVGEELELRITNPQAFRSVKHVIIMTT